MNTKKNAVRKCGHRACLHFSGLLKWGIFTGCGLKIPITFIENEVLVTWKTQTFVLKAKLYLLTSAVLLHLSCFWLIGSGNIAQFRKIPWLAWSPRLRQNTPSWELFSKKNRIPLSNFFSSSDIFFIRLLLANTWKKIGGHRARLREKESLFRYRA